MTPNHETPMHGRKPICNVCKWQIRPVDAPTDTDCFNLEAQFHSENCSTYEPVTHEQLAIRVAELDNLLTIAWDVMLVLLEHAEKLPEVPE